MTCLFSFFSMIFPVVLGFIGLLPFLLASVVMILCLWGIYHFFQRKLQDQNLLLYQLLIPSGTVISLFLVAYMAGWIPPVPLSIENMGIYHKIEKQNDRYILFHQNPWWRFWNTADEDFLARDGDQIYFFAKLFSPARFSDSVILHWFFKDPLQGWLSTDRIPMTILGGRAGGYRGFSKKANYQAGDWKVSVETTDGREIGRIYFKVKMSESTEDRYFNQVEF
jgi:hypothetical protein